MKGCPLDRIEPKSFGQPHAPYFEIRCLPPQIKEIKPPGIQHFDRAFRVRRINRFQSQLAQFLQTFIAIHRSCALPGQILKLLGFNALIKTAHIQAAGKFTDGIGKEDKTGAFICIGTGQQPRHSPPLGIMQCAFPGQKLKINLITHQIKGRMHDFIVKSMQTIDSHTHLIGGIFFRRHRQDRALFRLGRSQRE